MNTPHDDDWIARSTALLDRSADDLDAATLSRLNRARQVALAARPRVPRRWVWSAACAGAAAAVFAVAIGLHQRVERPAPAAPSFQAGDIDVLTNDDDVDLYENLDFYAWLGAQRKDSNG